MTPENVQLSEASAWLVVASEDLRMANLALKDDPPIIGSSLYHAQQAAEKALKGLLVFHGRAYPLTHNLTELAKPAISLEPGVEAVVTPGLGLSAFATLYRYPGESETPPIEEAQRWLDVA